MDQKVILITGASGGIGGAISSLFSNENVKLALHYNSNKVELDESDDIAHFKADLTHEKEVVSLIDSVLKRFGRIDVLINNAGISNSAISWKTDSSLWRKTMAINLDAPFFLSKYIIPHFRSRSTGNIINVTSIVAQTGFVGTAAYSASKSGLIGLTKTLSKELIITAKSKANFKIGISNKDQRLHDFIINIKSSFIDIFKVELEKYLKGLKKI